MPVTRHCYLLDFLFKHYHVNTATECLLLSVDIELTDVQQVSWTSGLCQTVTALAVKISRTIIPQKKKKRKTINTVEWYL